MQPLQRCLNYYPHSIFDARLGFDALLIGVLDAFHFCDQVGFVYQFLRGAAAGDDDMRQRRLQLETFDHLGNGEKIVFHHVVQFVEDHQLILRIGEYFLALFPCLARAGDVLF